jgi:hypothetical protein
VPTAFISYSHHDRDFVQRLVPDLERTGLDVWWDQELEGGAAFADRGAVRKRGPQVRVVSRR